MHKLYLSVSGPARAPGQPIVLLMQGIGATLDERLAVQRLVSPVAKWAQYDRSGLGRSESAPDRPKGTSAVTVATELDALLKFAGIEPPFIIVAHSWGGITSREFLHLRPNDVVGMVFVDAKSETSSDPANWPAASMGNVMGDLEWFMISGLDTTHVLSEEEWQAVVKEQRDPRHSKAEIAEWIGSENDPQVLGAKKQFEKGALGDKPVSVIASNSLKDFQMMYDAGVAAGNGSEEHRRLFREYLERYEKHSKDWQMEMTQLSTKSHFVTTSKAGHNVQMQYPQIILEEIQWVLSQL